MTIGKKSIKLWIALALAILSAAVLARVDATIQLIDYSGAPAFTETGVEEAVTLSSDPEWRYLDIG
jgi:hypothetical protein